jgi:hypothetical protein
MFDSFLMCCVLAICISRHLSTRFFSTKYIMAWRFLGLQKIGGEAIEGIHMALCSS